MRTRTSTLATALATVAAGALATVAVALGPASAAPLPFSEPPRLSGMDVAHYAGPIGTPGTMLSTTTLDPAVSLPAASRAYRIHYSTTDVHGRPATSTGQILLPRRPAPRGGYPVIAWAHGTVGSADQCAPSTHPELDDAVIYLSHWLDQGYAIVATDYAGLGTPGNLSYLSTRAAAHSVIDSVVAAHRTDLPLAAQWAIVGHSQGAAAAMSAARRATEYTRGTGLDYRGVVATGTPANVEHVVWQIGPGVPPVALPAGLTAYSAAILAGFADARRDFDQRRYLTAAGRRAMRIAQTQCTPQTGMALRHDNVADWFTRPISSIPGVKAALIDYMAVPYTGYDRPILMVSGLPDRAVPIPFSMSLAAQLVANRQPVHLVTYPDTGHSATMLRSMSVSTPFLARILR
ncbi:lipase family protein [Gordonia sp. ABSL1-1]|uniref:alpha/beta hydrolase family protein n=1 Tax=Gordonia sp. ABSL1-1 TaxID=3053923 RepID=UPI0025733194|nr:lipase family protein [Gordonia sp. ABSL1-1]MDL9938368.1 lipase family protein [Gordonia sp. ABSL1-1]